MPDLKTDIENFTREELLAIARNVTMMNTYHFRDLSGKTLGYIATTAPKYLLERVWGNLRELNHHATLQELITEMNDRDYYAELISVEDFLIMTF